LEAVADMGNVRVRLGPRSQHEKQGVERRLLRVVQYNQPTGVQIVLAQRAGQNPSWLNTRPP
jgi:hypothetical protein